MNLGKYIHELLLENETIIIPGFGAFVSNYKPAEINEETQDLIPPSKEIIFNRKIRNNDGLLVGHVAEMLSVSHFDALKKIEKERENMVYLLDKGEKVTLEETGVLSIGENQEIQFESFIEDNLLLDSFGLEAVSFQEEENIVPTEKVNEPINEVTEEPENEFLTDKEIITCQEEIIESGEETEIESPEISDETLIIQESEEQNVETELEISDEESETEVTGIISEQEMEAEWDEKQNNEPEKVAEPVLVEETPEKKKRGWLWLLLIFIPVLIAGFFVVNNQLNSKKSGNETPLNPSKIQLSEPEVEIAISDSVKTDSTQIRETESTEMLAVEKNSTQNYSAEDHKFFLIGGSFKEEGNAQKFIDQFEIEGYNPFHMGKIGNYYFVGFGSFETEAKAVAAKNQFLEKNPDSGIWVYEKK